MNQQPPTTTPSFRWFTNLSGAYLLFMMFVLTVTVFIFKPYQNLTAGPVTPTPAITATPHILVRQPGNQDSVVYEDFSSNSREWGIVCPYGKLEVINGKLVLQTNIENRFSIAGSREFDLNADTYYVQADFSTDVEARYGFGLIFGFSRSQGTYYMFNVAPTAGYYRLLKYNGGGWDELIPFAQTKLNPYPDANTLSVYFDRGRIELYLNGSLLAESFDEDYFRSAQVGVFVDNAGYRLIVDNFFAYTD